MLRLRTVRHHEGCLELDSRRCFRIQLKNNARKADSNIAQNRAMIHKNHDVVLKLVYELLSRQDNKYQLYKSYWLQLTGAGLSECPPREQFWAQH